MPSKFTYHFKAVSTFILVAIILTYIMFRFQCWVFPAEMVYNPYDRSVLYLCSGIFGFVSAFALVVSLHFRRRPKC